MDTLHDIIIHWFIFIAQPYKVKITYIINKYLKPRFGILQNK